MISRTCCRWRPGTAMTEMVLVAPLLALILALVLFFGRGVVHFQRTLNTARYEAWREAVHAPGPRPYWDGTQHYTATLNQTFFIDRATRVDFWAGRFFPRAAWDELIGVGYARSQNAGRLMDETFSDLPRGRAVHIRSLHPMGARVYEPFHGPMKHRHVRIGNDWRFAQNQKKLEPDDWRLDPPAWEAMGQWWYARGGVSIFGTVRDVFWPDMDEMLRQLGQNDVPMARMIRGLYLHNPEYRGPRIPKE